MKLRTVVNKLVKEAMERGLVEGITVEVGELASIPPDELEEALKQTKWDIKVEIVPAKVECKCTYVGPPKITEKSDDLNIYHCPACGRMAPEIIDGNKVELKHVRLKGDEDDEWLDIDKLGDYVSKLI